MDKWFIPFSSFIMFIFLLIECLLMFVWWLVALRLTPQYTKLPQSPYNVRLLRCHSSKAPVCVLQSASSPVLWEDSRTHTQNNTPFPAGSGRYGSGI